MVVVFAWRSRVKNQIDRHARACSNMWFVCKISFVQKATDIVHVRTAKFFLAALYRQQVYWQTRLKTRQQFKFDDKVVQMIYRAQNTFANYNVYMYNIEESRTGFDSNSGL